MEKYSFFLALVGVFIASCAQLLMKKSANEKKTKNFLSKFLNVKVIFAYAMMFGSSLISVLCLRYLQLKFVPMIEATGFLWVTLFSITLLKEKPSVMTLVGGGTIILGMICFGFGSL